MVLLFTGGWWELENFATLERIVAEPGAKASVEYSGAVLRPHAFLIKQKGS